VVLLAACLLVMRAVLPRLSSGSRYSPGIPAVDIPKRSAEGNRYVPVAAENSVWPGNCPPNAHVTMLRALVIVKPLPNFATDVTDVTDSLPFLASDDIFENHRLERWSRGWI
jgi:hypothetical protein